MEDDLGEVRQKQETSQEVAAKCEEMVYLPQSFSKNGKKSDKRQGSSDANSFKYNLF